MKQYVKKYTDPQIQDPDLKARSIVLNWILLGSIFLSITAFLNALVVFAVSKDHLFLRLGIILLVTFGFVCIYKLAQKPQYTRFVAILVSFVFLCIATGVIFLWSISNSTGILLMSVSITTAGILISARQSLYFALYGCVIITVIQILSSRGIITQDLSWTTEGSQNADVVTFSVLFAIAALVSWLFNRQMEHSLQRAQRSEIALKRQKALLEVRVEERTRELEKLQLEKMQQFYRFAELGRLSTSLFHDLANHLTTINMDLEGLSKTDKSKMMQRIQQNASYIDDVIKRVREQLLGKEEAESFNIDGEIREIISILKPKANQANVTIQSKTTGINTNIILYGSLTRFRQVVINLLSNAIDSYDDIERREKIVTITASQNKTTIAIAVQDYGCGIADEHQADIFKPFYSTKHSGVGIGLFIVKQITKQYFKGSLSLVSGEDIGSTFTIKIPKK